MADTDEDTDQGALNTLNPYGFKDAYAKLYSDLQQQAQQKQKAQQAYLSSLQQQEGALSQIGMSDLDKAALWAQVAGAFGAPTKSGGFTETLGNVGTALAGPLSKQAEAQRARQQQLQQLQLARQKMGMEMAGSGQPSVSETLQLMKAQQDAAVEKTPETFRKDEVDGKPVLVGSRGTIKPFDYKAAGIDPSAKPSAETSGIPADVVSKGPEAVKEWVKAYGKKTGEEYVSAQSAADNIAASLPILQRAETAYEAIGKKGGIGPYAGSEFMQNVDKYTFGAVQKLREDYRAAEKQLETLKARIEMKGQGAITDYERKLLQLQLPTFDAQDPETGLETLRQLRSELEHVAKKPQRILQRGGGDQQQPTIVPFGSLK